MAVKIEQLILLAAGNLEGIGDALVRIENTVGQTIPEINGAGQKGIYEQCENLANEIINGIMPTAKEYLRQLPREEIAAATDRMDRALKNDSRTWQELMGSKSTVEHITGGGEPREYYGPLDIYTAACALKALVTKPRTGKKQPHGI